MPRISDSILIDMTQEPQYQEAIDFRATQGSVALGLTSNVSYFEDPKRFLFSLSRYKFAAKMLNGTDRCLEIGWGMDSIHTS